MDFNLLKEMREFLKWRSGDAVMLAEANVPPDESLDYFGADGDRLQMMLNFAVNQRLFYALATADIDPLVRALEETRKQSAQRAVGPVPAQPRRARSRTPHRRAARRRCSRRSGRRSGCSSTIAASGGGWRRCSATTAGSSSSRSACCSRCPGTPMMQYGDEIGIGDNLRLPERECARTPMQWTAEQHGGFSRARRSCGR